jgi:hypothetical protein
MRIWMGFRHTSGETSKVQTEGHINNVHATQNNQLFFTVVVSLAVASGDSESLVTTIYVKRFIAYPTIQLELKLQ